MKKFICKECNREYGWVLEGNVKNTCAYCSGQYQDGTMCKGGNKQQNRNCNTKG